MQDRFVQLIIGGLIVVLLVLLVISWLVGGWLSQTREEEADRMLHGSADPAGFDASLDGCDITGDETRATVSVTNRSDRPAAFGVEVLFTAERGFVLDSARARSGVLRPDQTGSVPVTTDATGTGQSDTRCELLAVDDARE